MLLPWGGLLRVIWRKKNAVRGCGNFEQVEEEGKRRRRRRRERTEEEKKEGREGASGDVRTREPKRSINRGGLRSLLYMEIVVCF